MRMVFRPTGVFVDVPEKDAASLMAGGFEFEDAYAPSFETRQMTKSELIEEASRLGIKIRKGATKAELEILVNEARA